MDLEEKQTALPVTDAFTYATSNSKLDIETKESLLKKKKEEYDQIQQELSQLQTRHHVLTQENEIELRKKEQLKNQEEVVEKQISSLRNRMQEIVQKRNNAMGLLEEKRRDVGAISSIPAGAENYKNYNQNQLKAILNKANKHLLKFDKVNRKAMNQYLLFSERKNEFKKRHKELEEGMESIHALMAVWL